MQLYSSNQTRFDKNKKRWSYDSQVETVCLLMCALFYLCRERSVGLSVWEKSATTSALIRNNGNRQSSRPERQSPDHEEKNTSAALKNKHPLAVLRLDSEISIVHYSHANTLTRLQSLLHSQLLMYALRRPDALTNVQRLHSTAMSLVLFCTAIFTNHLNLCEISVCKRVTIYGSLHLFLFSIIQIRYC